MDRLCAFVAVVAGAQSGSGAWALPECQQSWGLGGWLARCSCNPVPKAQMRVELGSEVWALVQLWGFSGVALVLGWELLLGPKLWWGC